jgi:alcohol dehydrogenase (cytochrome c)
VVDGTMYFTTPWNQVWETVMADIRQGYSATIAPQVAGGKFFLGVSGGVYGARGFVDAYDLATGRRIWRFWTVPGPGEPGHDTWPGDSWKKGGGPVWVTPTYDADTRTLFVGTGNPGPVVDGSGRQGDNLYTASLLALDADSGELKWHFQVVPHDVWDYDNAVEAVIDDITVDGRLVKAVMFASKNGYFYVLDRTNGTFVYAQPFAHRINWGKVGPDGRAIVDPSKIPVKDRWVEVYPGAAGAREWCPSAYDPATKRMFVPGIENGHRHKVIEQAFRPGLLYWGGSSVPVPNEAYGHIVAIDVEQKRIVWDVRTKFPVVSGISATASGLVVTGTPDQFMLFLDARDGRELHRIKAPSGWHSSPVIYAVAGRQFIAFANGWGGWVSGFNLTGTPELRGLPQDNILFSFALPAP